MKLKYHKLLKGKVHINVYTGKVQVKVIHGKNTDSRSFEKSEKKEKESFEFDFISNLENNQGIDTWDPIHIEISNEGKTNEMAAYKIYLTS